jgi:hypothetical protein
MIRAAFGTYARARLRSIQELTRDEPEASRFGRLWPMKKENGCGDLR